MGNLCCSNPKAQHRICAKTPPSSTSPSHSSATLLGVKENAKGVPLLPLNSPSVGGVDLERLNQRVAVAETLAADSRAQALAADGKANSSNCRSVLA